MLRDEEKDIIYNDIEDSLKVAWRSTLPLEDGPLNPLIVNFIKKELKRMISIYEHIKKNIPSPTAKNFWTERKKIVDKISLKEIEEIAKKLIDNWLA